MASNNSRETYFIFLCIDLFKDRLLWIINTDSYLRQPCNSSRALDHFYFILENITNSDVSSIKYINGEFPEYNLNYLTKNELNSYPSHGKWQFCFSRIIYGKDSKCTTLSSTKSDHLVALSHAINGVGHISRFYYLNDMNEKKHTWAVRQLGWAFRYTENCIIKLWNYISYSNYALPENFIIGDKQLGWIVEINNYWYKFEQKFLTDTNSYKNAVLNLNDIIQYYANLLASHVTSKKYVADTNDDFNIIDFDFISSFRDEMANELKGTLKCLYLSGSAARGEQHKKSDIDTIGVFSDLNEEILNRIKYIVSKFDNISIYTMSINDLISYPVYKYYSLNEGTRKIYGEISFLPTNSNTDIYDSLINNIFILIQISRSYLIIENYGPRAHYILKLMYKLADHGCLRLIIKHATGRYPDSKEEIKKYYKDNPSANSIIDFVININENEDEIKSSLLHGNNSTIFNKYKELNIFSENFLSNLNALIKN